MVLLVARWVSLVLLLMLAGLQLKLWVSGGMRDVWRIEVAVRHQETENAKQQARNEQLAAEVSDLKKGAEAIEERARSELGMVKNDEVFYQVIESDGPDVDNFAGGLIDSGQLADSAHVTGVSGASVSASGGADSGGAGTKRLAQAAH